MRVDVHAHILPREWPDLAERYGDPRWPTLEHLDACSARILVEGRLFREIHSGCYDTGRRLSDMDEAGVDRQVLSTVPVMFSYWAEPRKTLELARRLNEHLVEVVSGHPRRFSGLGTVPLNDVGLAIEELERCVSAGLDGVEIGSNIDGLDLDAPHLLPFFERAAELNAVIFVHPWNVIGRERLRHEYYALYSVAMPSETAFAFAALVLGGVLERVPGLKLLFAHGGGSIPFILPRIDHAWGVWPPARELAPRMPSEYARRCFFDSLVSDGLSLELLVRRVGADRVLLGSDYPFLMGEERPGAIVESSGLATAEQALVLGGNFERVFTTSSAAGARQ